MQQIELLQSEKRHMEYKLKDLTERIKWQNLTIKDLKADNENKRKEIKFWTNQLPQPEFIVSEHTLHPLDFTYSVYVSNDYIPAVYDDRDNVITSLQARTEMQSEHIEELIETILHQSKSAAADIQDLRKELEYHNQCKIRELGISEELQNYKQLERGYKEPLGKFGKMLNQLEKENKRIRSMKNELQQDNNKLTMQNSNLLKHYNTKLKTLNCEVIKLQTELSRLRTKLEKSEKQNAKLKEAHPCKVEGIDRLSAKYRKQSERVFPSDWSTEENREMDRQLAYCKKQQEVTDNQQVKLLNELDTVQRRKTAEMEVSIKTYKQQLQNNAVEIGNLKGELENIKKQLQAKHQTEMSHEHNMKTMQLEIREKDSQLKDMERKLTRANKQIAKYGEQCDSKFSYNTNVSEYAKREIKGKNVIIQGLENTLENIKCENRRLKRKLEEACDDIENNFRKAASQKDDTHRQLVQKDDTINDLKRLLVQKDEKKNDSEKQLSLGVDRKNDLERQLMLKDDEVNKQAKENAALSKQLNQLKTKFESQERQHAGELQKLHTHVSELREDNQRQKQLQRQSSSSVSPELKAAERLITEKNKKIEELSNRVAKETMSKISADERALEYVSVKNRPMHIASEYELLCSNEWHDVKDILDQLCQQMKEEDKIKLLRFIFEVSECKCNRHFNMLMNQFESMLVQPMENVQQQSHLSTSVTEEVKVFVGDCLKQSADTANILNIVQDVLSEAGTKYHHEASTVFAHNNFRSYVEVCVRLVWKMVLQRPPMCFVQDGIGEKWQGDDKQELFWRSSDPSDPLSRVKYYVHPALHHGETMMVKGRVYLSRV